MAHVTQQDTHHPPERRRIRWWWALLAVAAVLLTLFVTWRLAVANRLDEEIQSLRAAGYPVSLAQLNEYLDPPPPPPSEKNGADWYRRAYEHHILLDPEAGEFVPIVGRRFYPPLENTEPMSAQSIRFASEYVADNAQTLELLRRANQFERTRFRERIPVDPEQVFDWLGGSHLPLSEIRSLANLLAVKAMVHAERDEPAEAAAALRGVWCVAEAMDEEPFMIEQLVRIATKAMMVEQLERALNRTRFTQEQLAMLSEVLMKEAAGDALTRAFIAELAFGIDDFGSSLDAIPIVRGLYRATGLLDMDKITYISYERDIIEAARHPMPRRMRELQAIERSFEQLPIFYTVVTQNHHTNSSLYESVHSRTITQIRNARTVLAVERYRLAHGELPEKLTDLVPEFLSAVPMDPFTGKPLQYVQLDNGYTIYSTGRDGTDDGGARTNAAGDEMGPGTDIPFTVKW